jgi:Fe-S cluster assembly ATPase SufC
MNGELVFEGDVNEILKEVRKNGYSNFSTKQS